MNTDELRAALEWASRLDAPTLRRTREARALLHLAEENAELRRVLVMWLEVNARSGEGWEEAEYETNRLLAGEVHDAAE